MAGLVEQTMVDDLIKLKDDVFEKYHIANATWTDMTMNSCLRPSIVVAGWGTMVARSTAASRNSSHGDMLRPQQITMGAVAFLLTLVFFSLLYHVISGAISRRREKESQRDSKLDDVKRRLVLKFAPLVAVDSYQFKGMKQSKCGVNLQFDKLGLMLKGSGRRVLNGVTGKFEQGKMIAIMGPSGSGKTTFMNVLCGKATYGNMTGTVFVNGQETRMRDLKPIMGFVPQDDIVHESLTVREQLEMHAKLRNDRSTSHQELKDIVEDVLHVLQIEHIQRSIVGGVEKRGISGGQRKRVNIGLELVACPVLLFLDEPTSGLDSTSSLMVVGSMKKMTTLGMTIIMVIHQPRYSLFALYDQVLLLGTGGHTVYSGSASRAVSYFENMGFERPAVENPADWMMDVISGQVKNKSAPEFKPKDLFDRWRTSGEAHTRAHDQSPDGDTMLRQRTDIVNQSHFVTSQLVNQEWEKVDRQNSGYIKEGRFMELLQNCCDVQPERKVALQLINQIGGDKSTWTRRMASRAGAERFGLYVVKEDFAEFLRLSCEEIVAGHRIDRFGCDMDDETCSSSEASTALTGSLEKRSAPGCCRQWAIMAHARMIQFWRDWQRRLINVCMIMFCAAAFAFVGKNQVGTLIEISMYQTGVALLIPVSVLPTFANRPIYWRMSSSGVSVVAYYMSHIAVSIIDALMLAIIYTMVYWSLVGSDLPFNIYLDPCLYLAWSVAAFGYFLSIAIPRESATLGTLVLMLAFCQVLGKFDLVLDSVSKHDPTMMISLAIVPTRWSNEMQFVASTEYKGGISNPDFPNCTDIKAPTNLNLLPTCLPQLANCSAIIQSNETTRSEMKECEDVMKRCSLAKMGEFDKKSAKRSFDRLSTFFKDTGFSQYLQWAYWVYTENGFCKTFSKVSKDIFGTWRNCHWYFPILAMGLQGVLLHVLALMWLSHQAPDAVPVKERCLCHRRRKGGGEQGLLDEDDDEDEDDTDEDLEEDVRDATPAANPLSIQSYAMQDSPRAAAQPGGGTAVALPLLTPPSQVHAARSLGMSLPSSPMVSPPIRASSAGGAPVQWAGAAPPRLGIGSPGGPPPMPGIGSPPLGGCPPFAQVPLVSVGLPGNPSGGGFSSVPASSVPAHLAAQLPQRPKN